MRGLGVDGGQLRQHGTGGKSRTVLACPGRQLPDDLVAADSTGVLQRSTLQLRPPKAQDCTEICVLGRGNNALGETVTDLVDHLPDGTGGDLRRARNPVRARADQGVDPGVDRAAFRVEVESLRPVPAAASMASMTRVQDRPEALDILDAFPEMFDGRVIHAPEDLDPDRVHKTKRA